MSGNILPFQGVLPTIGERVFVAPTATVIGDTVIGDDTSVWFNCVIRGDVHEIRIGSRTNIQDGTVIHVTGGKLGTYIGSDITIGHGAILHACTLEDACFIGMGAVVLDGAVVESGAMVAAGAVVTPGKRIKKGELWGGNPARMLRSLSEAEIAFFPESARKYVELAAKYR
jgi:carbonic anhydrase/acetyltransferase-like protein (isoleucine patch superfamily)